MNITKKRLLKIKKAKNQSRKAFYPKYKKKNKKYKKNKSFRRRKKQNLRKKSLKNNKRLNKILNKRGGANETSIKDISSLKKKYTPKDFWSDEDNNKVHNFKKAMKEIKNRSKLIVTFLTKYEGKLDKSTKRNDSYNKFKSGEIGEKNLITEYFNKIRTLENYLKLINIRYKSLKNLTTYMFFFASLVCLWITRISSCIHLLRFRSTFIS